MERDPAASIARWAAAAIAVGALANVAVGALFPVGVTEATLWSWVRIALTTCGVLCALYTPGLLLRARLDAPWRSCAFVWIPGFLYLAVSGLAAWGLGKWVVSVLTAPMPLLLLFRLRRGSVVARGERAIAVVMLLLLAIGIGKATWSQGPPHELYRGTVSRTLEEGDRSDSRVPYHSLQLVAHATLPYSELGQSYYSPWLFSDRSPMAGLASVTAVFTSGAMPPVAMPDQPWTPFDPQGFAAYRIAMMAFAATIIFSLYGLLRSRLSESFALGAVALVALCPFVVHEVYFTWPKLLSTSFSLVAVLLLLERRPLSSGLAMGMSYLAHPGGIFVVPTLVVGWWVVKRREPREWLRDCFLLVVAFGAVFFVWRFANRGHLSDQFMGYVREADGKPAASMSSWIDARVSSLANTFVPYRLLIVDSGNRSVSGSTQASVKMLYLYWATVPFGVGLLYFPLWLFGLWRFARHKPMAFTAVLGVPLLLFWLYWGRTITGMLREGLQFWFIASVVLAAFATAEYSGRGFRTVVRWIATARVVSILVMVAAPTIMSVGVFGDDRFHASNVVALALVALGTLGLGVVSFRWLDPSSHDEVAVEALAGEDGGRGELLG